MSATFDATMYRSELEAAQYAATAAYHAAMQSPDGPREFIKEAWQELFRRNQLPHGPEGKLAAAKEALAVIMAISQLAPQHYRALAAPEHYRAAGGGMSFDPNAVAAAATAAIASNQVLAKFQAERDQASRELAAEVEARRQAINAQMLRDAPRDLLTSLRERGVVLKLSGDGKHITAIPLHHALLQPFEINTIKERSADFLALLKAEAAAAAPVIIA